MPQYLIRVYETVEITIALDAPDAQSARELAHEEYEHNYDNFTLNKNETYFVVTPQS